MKVFFKPTCITCKRAISEIERMKVDFDKRDFFKEPLSEAELGKIIKLAKIKPKELLRKRDKMYKELNLEKSNHSDLQIIKFMVKYPGLISRPIIISNNKVSIGKITAKEIKSIK